MARHTLALIVALSTGLGAASGSSWADRFFDETSKDFGQVPRGPLVTHSFRLVNRTSETVHVSNVRVSCGCTSASIVKEEIAPGEETAVVAQMDTRRFTGHKAVTIFVTFDRPQWDEAQLVVRAYGRDDVVLTPDSFTFGRVRHGSSPSADVNVALSGGDWRIVGAHADSSYVQVSAKEQQRDGYSTIRVEARLLPGLPAGRWYTDVWLETNSPQASRLRVPLTVEVESGLSVTPTVASLGDVKTGAEVERRVVVRGTEPFRVLRVEGVDDELTVKDGTSEAKAVHVLTVKLKPHRAGDLTRTLRVVTDLKDDSRVEFQARAFVRQ